jgi:hypothetical protein
MAYRILEELRSAEDRCRNPAKVEGNQHSSLGDPRPLSLTADPHHFLEHATTSRYGWTTWES